MEPVNLNWFGSRELTGYKKALHVGASYIVFGKAGFFMNTPQITHPEMEQMTEANKNAKNFLEPVYPATEKLKAKAMGGRQLGKLTFAFCKCSLKKIFLKIFPTNCSLNFSLIKRFDALKNIHFPASKSDYENAVKRLKFEELFISQLRMGLLRFKRNTFSKGHLFSKVGDLFNDFYTNHLPFELTGAQKRVLKEIRKDIGSGKQMNRLLQGDVGSGKTIVALMAMLIAADNGYQSCFMAPTEILARQHFEGLKKLVGEYACKNRNPYRLINCKRKKRNTQSNP